MVNFMAVRAQVKENREYATKDEER